MKILCCCYPLLNSLSLCFYFTIASSRFLYTCNLTNRKRPEDFLVQKESSLVCSASVTMPWVGRASFLLSQTVQKYNSVFWCQCPERGDLHFYGTALGVVANRKKCQCPERGDLHFYDDTITRKKAAFCWCQCPERGDLHFYRIWSPWVHSHGGECQCPERGDLHFYEGKEYELCVD